MMVASKYREILERLGLTSLEQVRRFHGELVKNHRGRRDILRIVAADSAGRPLSAFLAECADRSLRRRVIEALADLVRRIRFLNF